MTCTSNTLGTGNKKKTLIVIDMQEDFVYGVLGTNEAVAIVEKVKEKIRKYYEAGHQIIFTRDTHTEDYLNTNEGKHLPVVHCVEGSDGWQIVKGLEVPGCLYVNKPTFGWTHWNEMNLGDVELIGVCTGICVVSNALIIKALFPENDISVDATCCACVTPESHKAALNTMKMCQINVMEEA